jgi:hypothetical protein
VQNHCELSPKSLEIGKGQEVCYQSDLVTASAAAEDNGRKDEHFPLKKRNISESSEKSLNLKRTVFL